MSSTAEVSSLQGAFADVTFAWGAALLGEQRVTSLLGGCALFRLGPPKGPRMLIQEGPDIVPVWN